MSNARPHRHFLGLLLSVAAINVLIAFLLFSLSRSSSLLRPLVALWVGAIASSSLIVLGGAIVLRAARGALEQISKGLDQLRTGEYPRLLVPESNVFGGYVRELNECAEVLRQRDEKTRLWAERRQSELDKAARLLTIRESVRQSATRPSEDFIDPNPHDHTSRPPLPAGNHMSALEAPREAPRGDAGLRDLDAEAMKSEFISTVSHELRTPLTAIKGSLSLIRSGSSGHIPSDTRDLIKIALANTDRLITTVNNMLDVTQLEAGGVQFVFRPITLRKVLNDALQTVAPDAAVRKIPLEVSIPEPSPVLYADGKRIGQVLTQLISNAVKFSAEGSPVRVSAKSDGRKVTIAVCDSGMGMTPEFSARLFRKFEHEKAILTRDTQGCGLGLAIARLIVEGHAGKIWAESSRGEGSTFLFTIPAASPSQQPAMLIVDDDDDLRPSLDDWCSSRGYRLLACRTPDEVVKLAQRWRPQLVVLDIDFETSTRLARELEGLLMAVICFEGQGPLHPVPGPNLHVIAKPLNPADLDNVADTAATLGEGNRA